MNATEVLHLATTKSMDRTRNFFKSDKRLAVILVLPTVVILLGLVGWPLVFSARMSLSDVVIGQTLQFNFVGLKNYVDLFNDPRFQQTLLQTLVYSTAQVSGVMLIGLCIATLLNQRRESKVLKHVFLIPWALSPVVNAVIWGWILNGSFGILNFVLLKLGVITEYHVWLAEPATALFAIIIATIWKGTPFVALMLLAALQNVSQEYLDAAKVDGANSWQCFTKITLPCIKPTTLVLLVMETMWSLKSFDLIWVLTQGGPVNRTMLLSIFAYEESFRFFKFGYGSASAFVITFLIFGLTLLYVKLLRGFED